MKYFVLIVSARNTQLPKGILNLISLGFQFLPSELQFHGRATWQKPTFKVQRLQVIKKKKIDLGIMTILTFLWIKLPGMALGIYRQSMFG